jgi:hypothetical protein
VNDTSSTAVNSPYALLSRVARSAGRSDPMCVTDGMIEIMQCGAKIFPSTGRGALFLRKPAT